jgi:hypothetical protein
VNGGDWTGVMGKGERCMDSVCILEEHFTNHVDGYERK